MTTTPNRSDLEAIQGANNRVVRGLEDLFGIGKANSDAIEGITDATQGITDATVLTLSSNAAFNNERIFTPDPNVFSVVDNGPGAGYLITLINQIMINGGFSFTANLSADTNLNFPPSGTVLTDSITFPGPFANDAAAATGGVDIAGAYRRSDGVVAWRQS